MIVQLEKANLTKTELANNLGVSKNTVSNWGNTPPQYVIAYLDLYIELRNANQAKQWLKRWFYED